MENSNITTKAFLDEIILSRMIQYFKGFHLMFMPLPPLECSSMFKIVIIPGEPRLRFVFYYYLDI